MKKNLLLIGFIICFSLTTCRKKQEPVLPPETTIGAMSFGCKINGKVFVPKDGRGKSGLIAEYVYLRGGWYLNIPAFDYIARKGISIETDSLLLEEGHTYEFKSIKGSSNAFYIKNIPGGVDLFLKTQDDIGELHISKHDKEKRILSGRFFFTGTNKVSGQQVKVTDGRFDIQY